MVSSIFNGEKDRSAYNAYMAALADVKKMGNLAIPLVIRNAPDKFDEKSWIRKRVYFIY